MVLYSLSEAVYLLCAFIHLSQRCREQESSSRAMEEPPERRQRQSADVPHPSTSAPEDGLVEVSAPCVCANVGVDPLHGVLLGRTIASYFDSPHTCIPAYFMTLKDVAESFWVFCPLLSLSVKALNRAPPESVENMQPLWSEPPGLSPSLFDEVAAMTMAWLTDSPFNREM